MLETRVWSLRPGRSPGGGHSYPLRHSCLENPMDRGSWQGATVHGAPKSQPRLSDRHSPCFLTTTLSFCLSPPFPLFWVQTIHPPPPPSGCGPSHEATGPRNPQLRPSGSDPQFSEYLGGLDPTSLSTLATRTPTINLKGTLPPPSPGPLGHPPPLSTPLIIHPPSSAPIVHPLIIHPLVHPLSLAGLGSPR